MRPGKAVAAYHLPVATRRHDDLVDTESSPVLDCFVGDIVFEAQRTELVC